MASTDLLNIELLLEEYLEQIRAAVQQDRHVEVITQPQSFDELKTVLKPVTAQEIADALAPYFARLENDTQIVEAMNAVRQAAEKIRYPETGKGYVQTSIKVGNKSSDPVQTNITNSAVNVTNTTATEIGQGKFNIYGSGKISLAVAGNFRATLKNPATSGKTIKVHRISAFGTSTGWASILINPTTGLPVTAVRPSMNAIVGGGAAGIAEVKADSDTTVPLGGGTDTGIVLGVAGGTRTELNLPPLIVAPGVTLGFNVPFAGAADVTLAVYATEV